MTDITVPQQSLYKQIYQCTKCPYFWRHVVERDRELTNLYSLLKEYFNVGLAFGCTRCKDRAELERIMLGKQICLIKRRETHCEKGTCRNGICAGGGTVHDRPECSGDN